jgi:hypothetical protein
MIRPIIHLILHLVVPGVVARFGFRSDWKRAWTIMVLTMLVDLDHLLAEPMYDPARCSIGFHPLHTAPAVLIYIALALWPKTRVVGAGLLIHMVLDGIDCLWMGGG